MKKIIFAIIIIIFITILYALYISPNLLNVKEYTIKNSNLPNSFNNLKIVQFSDVLYDNNLDMIEKVVNKINDQNPDIIVFTGDLLKEKISNDDKDKITNLLSKLKCNLYKYAIKGDNDNEKSIEILNDSGFKYLDNSSEYLFYKGNEPILIVGGDNITEDSLLKDEKITYNFKLALIHKPDDYDNIKDLVSIAIAGHSLGGQIRLPFWGALIKDEGASKYTDDVYENLYISYGIGLGNLKMRLLNNPSINVYRLETK